MSRIKGKNTKPEILVRKFLFANGVRYRIHSILPGRPDIVIKNKNLATFVNGCFWHGHENCKNYRLPKSNVEFWRAKIEGNVQRDQSNYATLRKNGWKVIVVWECDIKNNREETLSWLLACVLEKEPL